MTLRLLLPALFVFVPPALAQERTVLFVVSAADTLPLKHGGSHPETGVFLSELYLPYLALTAAGYRVEFASPRGGIAHVDRESTKDKYWRENPALKEQALAFSRENRAFRNPRALEGLADHLDSYVGVVVPGGQGLMTDLLVHPDVPRILQAFAQAGKPIGLICHAPALLLTLPPHEHPFQGYRVNSVSAVEEWYIEIFVLKDKPAKRQIGRQLERIGLRHCTGWPGRPYALRDRELVTSQNPFSSERFNRLYLQALAEFVTSGSLRK